MNELAANQILAYVPEETRSLLAPKLTREELKPLQLLRDELEPFKRIYFPIDSVISIVTLTEDGRTTESYTAGRDGIAGAEILLGVDEIIQRSICQVPGVCYSMNATEFTALTQSDARFDRAVRRYLHYLLALTAQSAACNLMHNVDERCARWLLITQDRVGKDDFLLTQDIMATMLGVHRPAVTIAAGTLQKAGLIQYARGHITVVDRHGLESASCECYRTLADELQRVLGAP